MITPLEIASTASSPATKDTRRDEQAILKRDRWPEIRASKLKEKGFKEAKGSGKVRVGILHPQNFIEVEFVGVLAGPLWTPTIGSYQLSYLSLFETYISTIKEAITVDLT